MPKIFLDSILPRSVLRRPQTAEQLVEVPTIISCSSLLQRTDKLIVDIPVPGRGGGGRGGIQGSHPGQSSTAGVAEQIVEIPGRGDPQGFLPRQSTLQRTVEQFADIPVPAGGGLDGIRLDPGGPSSSAVLRYEHALLHMMSKVRVPPGVRVRGCTRTRAHGLWRLMRPRSVRTQTSSTSSSTFVASPVYVDGSRLGQGLPIGSWSQIGVEWAFYAG